MKLTYSVTKSALAALFFLISLVGSAQESSIKGRVFDALNNEPVPFASVVIEGTNKGASTDFDGKYEISALAPGTYSVLASYVGFKRKVISEVQVSSSRSTVLDFALERTTTELKTVNVAASPFTRTAESPVSLRTINATEIQRNPGGNRDISRVIQSLPGVASSVSFRNDIIIRGGAPSENRFYLDGIEVPNINHFATQGSSGGPVGLINVNFIREVDFFSGAFPAQRGNALSSIFEFKQKEGNPDKLVSTFTVGSSDLGMTFDGPLGEKSNFIFSVRRSYLQFVFKALALPFLPIYNDAQFKQVTRIGKKDRLTFIGLGAIDDFELNQSVNDNLSDAAVIERNEYILSYLPVNTQWNYTLGARYDHYFDKGLLTTVLSRNHLSNRAFKYLDNDESKEENKLQDYNSQEIENKLRVEYSQRTNGYRLNTGFGIENARYTNSTFLRTYGAGGVPALLDFDSELRMIKGSAWVQLSKNFIGERLSLSAGLRTDINDYSSAMSNPLEQISPRISASYFLDDKWALNFNTGIYYQLPAYTALGYRDEAGTLLNRENGLTYIESKHLVAGLEYNPGEYAKITMEGFYKTYSNYPFSIRDSIAIANIGADFGVIGNEALSPLGEGRSYGLEFLAQQKLRKGFYGILALTFVRSEFEDKNGSLIPSAWDNRVILNFTGGKKFGKNWEIGARFRFNGGTPFTPFDAELSARKEIWDVSQQALPDYALLNSQRLGNSHGLDMRLDKKWFFDKKMLNIYFDFQNVYNFQIDGPAFLVQVFDEDGNALTDPNDSGKYLLREIPNPLGSILPSLGLMFEF